MFTGQVAVISNKATWRSDVIELVDDSTGTTTDLSDPEIGTVEIAVTIKDLPSGNCCTPRVRVAGSITTVSAVTTDGDGKVTIPGPGFQWQFEVSDLSNLCAGTYGLGVKVTINDFATDVIDGTIAVVEGN